MKFAKYLRIVKYKSRVVDQIVNIRRSKYPQFPPLQLELWQLVIFRRLEKLH